MQACLPIKAEILPASSGSCSASKRGLPENLLQNLQKPSEQVDETHCFTCNQMTALVGSHCCFPAISHNLAELCLSTATFIKRAPTGRLSPHIKFPLGLERRETVCVYFSRHLKCIRYPISPIGTHNISPPPRTKDMSMGSCIVPPFPLAEQKVWTCQPHSGESGAPLWPVVKNLFPIVFCGYLTFCQRKEHLCESHPLPPLCWIKR